VSTHRATSADAILVYLITVAYLHDIEISDSNAGDAWHAEKVGRHAFSIWPWDESVEQEDSAPAAICTYNRLHRRWKVVLHSGESLTLYDRGDIWDIA
jgi:hypothetical protein